PTFSNTDKILFYSCIGGTPYYLSQIDNKLTFAENIQELFFDIYGSLYSEPIMLLYQELSDPKLYNSIIQAIASGATKLNEIHQSTYIEKSTLSKYIKTLTNMKIIKRTVPFDANPLKNKNSCYEISDNLYRFWFRFIFPNQEEIERGRGSQIFKKLVLPKIDEFASKPSFESICLDFLYKLEQLDQLPLFHRRSGSWRGKLNKKDNKEIEFDLIMDNFDEKEILIGECKWRNKFNDVAEIKKLMENSIVFNEYQKKYFVFFSKVNYSKLAVQLAKANGNVQLYTVDDLFLK
ncbi:MAG: ATP-binding protein, partial [Candidatus Ancillula sp.]|nr:ATP-binding protein [Candidatus Ancillula sp.]